MIATRQRSNYSLFRFSDITALFFAGQNRCRKALLFLLSTEGQSLSLTLVSPLHKYRLQALILLVTLQASTFKTSIFKWAEIPQLCVALVGNPEWLPGDQEPESCHFCLRVVPGYNNGIQHGDPEENDGLFISNRDYFLCHVAWTKQGVFLLLQIRKGIPLRVLARLL